MPSKLRRARRGSVPPRSCCGQTGDVKRLVGVDEAEVLDGDPLEQPRTSASIPVIVLRLAVAAALVAAFFLYFIVDGDGEAPATFSLESWILVLLPPTALAVSLMLGYRLRVARPSSRQVSLSRASAAIAISGVLVSGLFSLLWLYGEWMDYGIG